MDGVTDAARPHDLLEPARADAVTADAAMPAWAAESLARAPLVVVRRARRRDRDLPVGVRGRTRAERFAAWLSPDAVKRRIRPEDLVRCEAWRFTPRAAEVPHFALLERVAALMRALELTWGPAGSIGYELATGIPTATAASDVDVVVRAWDPLPRKKARALVGGSASLAIRIDVHVETPQGAFALVEYAAGRSQIALRTVDGPRLVSDPWGVESREAYRR